MKTLFGPNDRYTPTANMVEDLSRSAIRETFKTWIKLGYSAREISYVLQFLVRDEELMAILDPDYPPKDVIETPSGLRNSV